MTRNWKMLGLQTLLAAALTAVPSPAGPFENPPPEPDKYDAIAKQLTELRKMLEGFDTSIKKKLGDIETKGFNTELRVQKTEGDVAKVQGDLDELKRQVAKMSKDLETIQKQLSPGVVSGYGPNAGEELKKQLDRLRLDLDGLRSQVGTTRIATAAPAVTGKIRLINTYPEEMPILLNQTVYRLQPGESWDVSLPAGSFTYQVLKAQQSVQSRLLAANETFTITVHPR